MTTTIKSTTTPNPAPSPGRGGRGERLFPTPKSSLPGTGRAGGEAVFLVIFGILLIIIAFWVPPTGVIDPTVLTAFGETLTFAGSLIGLDYHYRSKTTTA